MLSGRDLFVRITSSACSYGCDGTPEVMFVRGYPHMWWKCCPTSWWISTVVGATSCVPASASVAAGAAAGAGVAATVGAAAGAGATAATAAGAGAPAVDSTSATVKPSALYVPPFTGILLPPTSAELACICSAAAPTNAAFPVCKPSIILVTSAPSVLVSPSSSLSNRASKIPPCAASKLVTSVWKVCRLAITAAVAAASCALTAASARCPITLVCSMTITPELYYASSTDYFDRRLCSPHY